ncbi:MAG: sigma-70 family RNA polymerase sigma factor [Myxococcota bacterium]
MKSFKHENQLPDDDLVAMAQRGDDAALEEIFERHGGLMRHAARKILRSDDDVQEALQNALLKIFTRLETYNMGSSFGAWAHRIVTNEALGMLRRRKIRDRVFEKLPRRAPHLVKESVQDPHDQPWMLRADRVMEARQTVGEIQRAVEDLAPIYRETFELFVFEERPLKDIATSLGISVPAVKSRLHRARLELRDALAEHVL